MFAASIAFSLGVKLDAIRQGLRTFDTTFFQAPGRMNVFNEHPFKVLFDYGHNAHAVAMLADLAGRLDVTGRRIVVLAGPGDRRDEDLRAIARRCRRPLRSLHLPARRQPARSRARRSAAHHGRGAARGRRAAVGDLGDTGRAGSDRCGAQHGPPGDLLLIFADALVRSWKQIIYFRPEGATESAAARAPAPVAAAAAVEAPIESSAPLLARRPDPRRARHPLCAGGVRLSETGSPPFTDSRRLTGHNRFFDGPGAVLESTESDAGILLDWAAALAPCAAGVALARGSGHRRRACERRIACAWRPARPALHRDRGQ